MSQRQWFDFTNVDTFIGKDGMNQYRLKKLVNQLMQGKFLGTTSSTAITLGSVATAASLPTPTGPAIYYVQDTGAYYMYNIPNAVWFKMQGGLQ